MLYNPILLSSSSVHSSERDLRISEFLSSRERIFANADRTSFEWGSVLRELDELVQDFDPSVQITTGTNTPWRVWGEVKRHRTMPQVVEGVYHAAKRALNLIDPQEVYDSQKMRQVVSIPPGLESNPEHFRLWMHRFVDSLLTYDGLVQMGVPKADAAAVIPRGLKLGVVKQYGLYNLTTGYMSLRLCNSAEPEMRATTEAERDLIFRSGNLPGLVEELMVPKCGYSGFCPEKKTCASILEFDPGYNGVKHKRFNDLLKQDIRSRL